MEDTYLTIARPSEGLYKEKGSKFLAFAVPISSVEEVKPYLDAKRKEFHDARHVCFAYILGPDGKDSRSNDDGEPSGTAGKPMLGVLLSNKLTNTLLVVVRYFGGTKLGTSGLINAYREACSDAIAQNEIVERTVDEVIEISFGYTMMNEVMRVVKEEAPTILHQEFDNLCRMRLSIRKASADRLRSRLRDLNPFHQKPTQMEVGDAVVIVAGDEGCH